MAGSFAASGETIFPPCSVAPAGRVAPQASAPTTPALSGKIPFCAGSFRKIRAKRNATWRWLRHCRPASLPLELVRGDGQRTKTLAQIVQITPGICR
jgi:hypothetical protein